MKRIGGAHVDSRKGRRGGGGENEGSSVSEHGERFTKKKKGGFRTVRGCAKEREWIKRVWTTKAATRVFSAM